MYTTFKYYDVQGRRLSIFCTIDKDLKTSRIFILTCAKSDTFNKKKGRQIFEIFLETGKGCNPAIIILPYIISEKDLIAFLNKIFLKKGIALSEFEFDALIDAEGKIIKKVSKIREIHF